jgi:hypothetical protein
MTTDMKTRKIWQDAMSANDECLDLAVLERMAEPGTVAPDAKAARHLAECPHCQTELAMLKRFEAAEPLENEGAAVAWIAAQLQRNGLSQTASSPVRRVSIWQSLFAGGFSWKPVAVALALVFVFGAGYMVMNRGGQPSINVPQIGVGPFRSGTVKLAGPAGELTQAPTELKWEAFQGAASYSVELMEVDKTVLSKTQVQGTQLTLTPQQQQIMKPGKPILWQVTALDAAGNEIANSASREQFKVIAGGR